MARVLGLDIAKNSLRGAVARTALRKVELERIVEVPIENNDVPAATAALFAELGRPPDAVIVALAGEHVSLRYTEIDSRVAKQASRLIGPLIENALPFEVEEAVIDYRVVANEDGQTTLLVAACEKKQMRELLGQLTAAAIRTSEVAPGAAMLVGIVTHLPAVATGGPHIFADMDERSLDVCVVQSGAVVFGRTVVIRDGAPPEAITSSLMLSVAAFRSDGGEAPVSLYLSGARVDRFDLGGITTSLALSPIMTATSIPVGSTGELPPSFIRALALVGRPAIRGKQLDMLQGEFARKEAASLLKKHAPGIALGAGLVFLSFVFAGWAEYRAAAAQREGLRAQLEVATERHLGRKISSVEDAERALRGEKGLEDPLPSFDAFDVLLAIRAAIPNGVQHDVRQLTIELPRKDRDGRFDIDGTVKTIEETEQVTTQLRTHRCFHDVSRGRTNTQGERLQYEVQATVQCDPAVRAKKNKNKSKSSTASSARGYERMNTSSTASSARGYERGGA